MAYTNINRPPALSTSRHKPGGSSEWYTLDLNTGGRKVESRMYITRDDALKDACLALAAGIRPTALWEGNEFVMNAAEIEDSCRKASEEPAD